ncbi:PBP superfamily domain protein [Geobacter sp. OR-1]|uniref:substrate-binding domain-containing protein n=1 Tax=Geobacter sp. OR-1 TaxID=1266765 RepID=UPI0005445640|nr:substrate-binding domain-containing protein [Geobacter sp. OR-1]GAM09860.1 PBP superfamily domain protein [Geobacter sp. OR-1]
MIRRYFTTIVTAAFLTVLVASPASAIRPRPPELFKIQGDSQSLAAVIFPLKETFQSENKMPLLIIAEQSAVKGLADVDSGIGDALVVAMSFEELNRLATEAGLERRNKALTQHSVLLPEVAYNVIVNPANPVSKLSEKELHRIFSGKYKEWDDVDGPKAPVAVVWGEWSTGASWILADKIMDGEPITNIRVKAKSVADIVAKVASDPNAIGIIPSSGLTNAVKAIATPELKISGPIIMVTVGFPTTKHFQLIKLLKGDGQQLIGY